MSKRLICINPGHGMPTDPGACGNGLKEAEVALKIGRRVESYLINAGCDVDVFQYDGLSTITNHANNIGADVFVSIHCNAANTSARGTETYYYYGAYEGRLLATSIQNQMLKNIPTTNRGVKEAGFYVIAYTDMPAVLVETAFIDNYEDSKLLVDYEDTFAKSITNGILSYLGMNLVDSNIPKEETVIVNKSKTYDMNFDKRISSIARHYESNNKPGAVSNSKGDLGGISYGTYQFASNVKGSVEGFVNWLCNYPDDKLANYGRVLSQNPVNSEKFIETWKMLGTVDPGHFGDLQDEYVKYKYYDVVATKLTSEGFNLEKHSTALKAVVFSRAVQNGPSGCVKLLSKSCSYPNLSYIDDKSFDKTTINNIYNFLIEECESITRDKDGVYHSRNDFCHGSIGIIKALHNRFINERVDALELLKAE